jgi:hypothetical protein
MKVKLTADYKIRPGKTIKKGTQMAFTRVKAQELIDAKKAKPLNFIEKAINKRNEKVEKAIDEKENEEK